MQKPKILVIEDERELSSAIKLMLELNNFDPLITENGTDGLRILAKDAEHVELVICDINLPDINGYEILKIVRNSKILFRLPFVFLSAYSDEQDIRTGMNEGADDYLTKPFKSKVLLDTIKSRLEISRKNKVFLENESSEKWLGILNAGFKQEFLTPLNGILNATHIIDGGIQTSSQVLPGYSETIGAIFKASFRMLRNTRNLLIYSTLAENRFKTSDKWQEDYSLSELLDQILVYYNKFRTKDSIKIESLVDQITGCKGESEYMNVILTELIDNSVKYGTIDAGVKIKLTNKDHEFEFCISNGIVGGVNFDMNDIRPFTKFHNDLSMNSLGIGLFICKELCRKLGFEFTMHIDEKIIKFVVSGGFKK